MKVVLLPNKITKKMEDSNRNGTNLLSLARSTEEMEDSGCMYVLLGKEAIIEVAIPEKVKVLIEEFDDVFLTELPDELPPLKDIQHQIDLELESALPNRAHYKMSPSEHKELRR